MAHRDTAEVIKRFNDSFLERDAAKLVDLAADDCVMESADPVPNGIRYEGYDACLRFWQELIADPEGSFKPEHVLVSGDRATISWGWPPERPAPPCGPASPAAARTGRT